MSQPTNRPATASKTLPALQPPEAPKQVFVPQRMVTVWIGDSAFRAILV